MSPSVLLFAVIMSGIATHIYNAKQEKVLKAELERERIRLGYADPEAEDEELEPLNPESEILEIVRECNILSCDSGEEGDEEDLGSWETISPIQHRLKTFSVNNM